MDGLFRFRSADQGGEQWGNGLLGREFGEEVLLSPFQNDEASEKRAFCPSHSFFPVPWGRMHEDVVFRKLQSGTVPADDRKCSGKDRLKVPDLRGLPHPGRSCDQPCAASEPERGRVDDASSVTEKRVGYHSGSARELSVAVVGPAGAEPCPPLVLRDRRRFRSRVP